MWSWCEAELSFANGSTFGHCIIIVVRATSLVEGAFSSHAQDELLAVAILIAGLVALISGLNTFKHLDQEVSSA